MNRWTKESNILRNLHCLLASTDSLAVQSYNLNTKWPKQTRQLHYLALLVCGGMSSPRAYTRGVLGLKPSLELDILQKLYYKGCVGLDFYKNKGSACRRICLWCQQTSLENMNMTSNCDVTKSAHQIQMTTIIHWMTPPWKFSAYATGHLCPLFKRLLTVMGGNDLGWRGMRTDWGSIAPQASTVCWKAWFQDKHRRSLVHWAWRRLLS